MLTFTLTLNVFPSTCLGLGYCYCVSLYFLSLFLPYVPCLVAVCQRELKSWLIDWLITFCQACSYPRNPYESYYQFRYLVNKGTMGVNSLPNTVTASRLRFEPRPSCAWVEHANHSATEWGKLSGGKCREDVKGKISVGGRVWIIPSTTVSPVATHVAWSVCLFVTTVNPTKTDERIQQTHRGCALVWHFQPLVVIFPCPTHYRALSVKCFISTQRQLGLPAMV